MATLRTGTHVQVPVTMRAGTQLQQAEVTTPCCGLTYRIDLEDIRRYYTTRPLHLVCGKRWNSRGRRPGGCDWAYRITFTRDADTITGSTWQV